MPWLTLGLSALLAVASPSFAQEAKDTLTFMGAKVTVTDPGVDETGSAPNGPATVCVEFVPQRQCHTPPQLSGFQFGMRPGVEVIQLDQDTPALLFHAASRGVSGSVVYYAILIPRADGSRDDLENLLPARSTTTDQSQRALWSDSSVSDAAIFVTADFVWGRDEDRQGPHRYIVAAYVRSWSERAGRRAYFLEDQYMTTRSYSISDGDEVLKAERPEILARLRRARQAR